MADRSHPLVRSVTTDGRIVALGAPLALTRRHWAAARRALVNAVAPGCADTWPTAARPLLTREAGRRTNSQARSGPPVDVARTTARLTDPVPAPVNGQAARGRGRSPLGA